MHDSHYHDVSEVNGAARDGHSHSPRELGAAEAHALDMHLRDYQSLAHTVSQLQGLAARDKADVQQQVNSLTRTVRAQQQAIDSLLGAVAALGQRNTELGNALMDLGGNVIELTGRVGRLTEALEQALLRGRI